MVAKRVLDHIYRGEYALGDHLTEQSLADALGVSRSPIRKALQYLEQLGALRSDPKRGFHLAKSGAQLRKLKLATDSESDEAVYLRIVEDRLERTLADEVSESELMNRYGSARLQVQRVLNRMAREGLAVRKAGRGWLFRPTLNTVEAHRDSYRLRMIIEPASILEPGFRIDRELFDTARRQQLQLLDGGIERWTAAERFRYGTDFHETIVACSGNALLLDTLRHVNQLRRIMEYRAHARAAPDLERMRQQCGEHLALLDLLEAGKRMEAAHALRQHLDVVATQKTGASAGPAPAATSPAPIPTHL